MTNTSRNWIGRTLLVGAAVLLAGCAGEPSLAPTQRAATTARFAASPNSAQANAAAGKNNGNRAVDLGACGNLQAPAGSKLAFHAYATGDQIYRWNGTSWVFVAPDAVLSADAGGHSTVGTHYAGPRWESNSGSTVLGTVIDRCTVGTGAIQWLSLSAVSEGGPGVFHRVTFIQRVNTTGGTAPTAFGSVVGEIARVPYTAEYFFYRAP